MFDSGGKYYRNGDKSNKHDWMDIGYEWTFTKQWAIPQPSETKENKVSSFKKNRSALVRLPAILTIYKYMEVSINGDPPIAGWCVMENPIKIDDLGVPPF